MSRHEDPITNPSSNTHLGALIEQRLDAPGRRRMLRGGIGFGALSFMGGASGLLAGCGAAGDDASAAALGEKRAPVPSQAVDAVRPAALGFAAVAKSLADEVAVPAGYTASVLYRLGDPLRAGVGPYANDGSDAAESFAWRAGDHHDGMYYFGLGPNDRRHPAANDRGVLAVNHEAITPAFLHPNGPTGTGSGAAQARTVPDEVLREFYAHGVSLVEVARGADGRWSTVQQSPFNRRVHTLTPMLLSGPAAGGAAMVTKYSPDGTRTRGTVNNCASGPTPWGTYLTCEENWAGYFRRIAAIDNPKRTPKELRAFARYGVAGNGRELWATVTPDTSDDLYGRWNAMALADSAAGDYRNAPNTFGWNVEIDPYAPDSAPKKRTGMGRFAHEGAWPARVVAGRPVVFYMGCDSRNEYIYKYVSNAPWNPSDADGGTAAGDKYLDDGRLYVAKFRADGTGEWIELSKANVERLAPAFDYPFADQADVLIHARLAADAVGATKMDRPEWGAVDPISGAVYMTLTNTNAASRPLAATDAANPRHYNGRPGGAAQWGNPNGHIVRWLETGADPAATAFQWDVFLFGARAGADPVNVNVSGLDDTNDFSSPDGLWFSGRGVAWIQTDDGAYTDTTNCMLLAALPGAVGDGGARTIANTDQTGASKAVQTWVGAPLGDKLRRFLVGPVECEITGITETPDGRSLFVNIQHPGEDTPASAIGTPAAYTSHWPGGGMTRPRSATIVITKDDGGIVGL